MRRRFIASMAVVFALVLVSGVFADSPKMDLKVGDQIYVCGCGVDCDCDTMARKPGKCVCGKPMVQGKVLKVEEGKAVIQTDKEEKTFKTVGLYMCACGADCDCGTISQKPGKCVCGKPMKKVE
jgi:hypothetical protein